MSYSTFDGTATKYDIRPVFKGVYTGDPTKDGTITVTSRSSTLDYATWYDSSYGTSAYTISNGVLEFNLETLKRQAYTSSGSSGSGSSSSGSGGTASGVTLPSDFQSKTVSAVFYYSEYNSYLSGNETTYLYFFSDNTFITIWAFENESEPASKGTYSMSGSWSSGSIRVTNQYTYDNGWIAWNSSEDGSPYATGTVSSSGVSITYDGNTQTFPRLQ